MARTRALMVFHVVVAGMRVRVRLLPNVADVDAEYRGGRRRSDRKVVHGYFQAAAPGARVVGTVAVPLSAATCARSCPTRCPMQSSITCWA